MGCRDPLRPIPDLGSGITHWNWQTVIMQENFAHFKFKTPNTITKSELSRYELFKFLLHQNYQDMNYSNFYCMLYQTLSTCRSTYDTPHCTFTHCYTRMFPISKDCTTCLPFSTYSGQSSTPTHSPPTTTITILFHFLLAARLYISPTLYFIPISMPFSPVLFTLF